MPRSRLRTWLVLGWLGCLPQPAVAADAIPTNPASPFFEYRQRVWTREQGLPDNRILCVTQTRDGFLWVGTGNGLARFDGLQFVVIDPLSRPAAAAAEVRSLAETADGVLWVGTREGLSAVRREPTLRFNTETELAGQPIQVLCASRAGELWVATDSALYRLGEGRLRAVPLDIHPKPSEPVIHSVVEDGDGTVWVASRDGVLRKAANEEHFRQATEVVSQPSGRHRTSLAERLALGPDGEIWTLGYGLGRFANALMVTVVEPGRLPDDAILALLATRGGEVWLGWERSGVWRWREGAIQAAAAEAGWVNCLFEDRDGNRWIGTEKNGLLCWQPRRFRHLTQAHGLPADSVWALTPAARGGAWLGTESGVAWSPDGVQVKPVEGLVLSRPAVRALHEAPDGTLWIGTTDSLERWQDGRVTSIRWEDEGAANKVRVVTSDRAGRLWVGRESGLMCLQEGRWRHFTTLDGLPRNDVRALREAGPDRLWVGTFGGGLCRVSVTDAGLAVERTLTVADGLPGNFVWVLHRDGDGVLWAGTDGGLARVVETVGPVGVPPAVNVTAFTRRQGLPSSEVNEIVEDGQDRLWLSSDVGLCRLDKHELQALAEGRAATLSPVFFNDADGLLSRETNGQKSQPAGCRTADGRLWFPTTRGVAMVDPGAPAEPRNGPAASLDLVQADGEVLRDSTGAGGLVSVPGAHTAGDHELRLKPGRARVVEFHYTAVEFRAAEHLRFRYRLRGWDRDWVEAGMRRTAFYTNLRPGHYAFEVQAARNLGVWGPVSVGFAFRLEPHLYERRGFWPAAVAAAGLGIAGVMSWRFSELRRLHATERERALAEERNRIARDMHDDLGASLSRLAMESDPVMNPASPPELAGLAREALRSLDAVVWATQPAKDSLPHLGGYLSQTAQELTAVAGMTLKRELPDDIPPRPLSATARQHLFLAAREAIRNAIRHSGSAILILRFRVRPDGFDLVIEDEGRGFDVHALPDQGNGLANMRERMACVGAGFRLESQPERGTRVTFEFPDHDETGRVQPVVGSV